MGTPTPSSRSVYTTTLAVLPSPVPCLAIVTAPDLPAQNVSMGRKKRAVKSFFPKMARYSSSRLRLGRLKRFFGTYVPSDLFAILLYIPF